MDCIFCEIAKRNINSNFVYEDDLVMAIMDINPICDGHVLIIPKDHYQTVFDVPKDVLMHMYEVAEKLTPTLMKATNEKGLTLSINYGDKQEIKHLHLHLVPNFEKKPSKKMEDVYKLIMDELNEKKIEKES